MCLNERNVYEVEKTCNANHGAQSIRILEKFLIMLDHKRNDIYIHIVRKSGSIVEEHFRQLCKRSHVIFIPRKRLHWGHSSFVECELNLSDGSGTCVWRRILLFSSPFRCGSAD